MLPESPAPQPITEAHVAPAGTPAPETSPLPVDEVVANTELNSRREAVRAAIKATTFISPLDREALANTLSHKYPRHSFEQTVESAPLHRARQVGRQIVNKTQSAVYSFSPGRPLARARTYRRHHSNTD